MRLCQRVARRQSHQNETQSRANDWRWQQTNLSGLLLSCGLAALHIFWMSSKNHSAAASVPAHLNLPSFLTYLSITFSFEAEMWKSGFKRFAVFRDLLSFKWNYLDEFHIRVHSIHPTWRAERAGKLSCGNIRAFLLLPNRTEATQRNNKDNQSRGKCISIKAFGNTVITHDPIKNSKSPRDLERRRMRFSPECLT